MGLADIYVILYSAVINRALEEELVFYVRCLGRSGVGLSKEPFKAP